MKSLQVLFLVFVLPVTGLLTSVTPAQSYVTTYYGNTYAAIAYSPSTGHYGWANGRGSRFDAEQAALRNCQGSDARIVAWVNNGFCALAKGDDNSYGIGYSYGDGATNTYAMSRALLECRQQTTKNPRVVLCIRSFN